MNRCDVNVCIFVQLSRITLPSGRSFELRYDNDGGLRHITLPSGTQHVFSIQPSLGFLRATYTPPGYVRSYLQHYSYDGRLLQTIYPGDGARILYKYHPSGKLAEVSDQVSTSKSYEIEQLLRACQ